MKKANGKGKRDFMSRKEARETVFKLVFEFCFSGEKNQLSLDEAVLDPNVVDEKKYIEDVYCGVIEKYDELSRLIEKSAQGFVLSRIFKIDLAIMLVSLFELKYYSIPPAVAINEAVNLAKVFSTEKSATFINGVLASLVKK